MPPPPQSSRINLAELKAQIVKKLGPQKSQNYFYYLNRFLSQKISKTEFDKLCCLTIGRENLALHNQLIQSILKNAYEGKVPPPLHGQEVPKSARGIKSKSSPTGDGYQQNEAKLPAQNPFIWSNGDVLPMSPRKSRSGIRDRRIRDRPSPLGPNGKTDLTLHQVVSIDEAVAKVTENGNLNPCDLQRPVEHRQGLAEQPETDQYNSIPLVKKPGMKKSPHDLVSVRGKDPVEIVNVADGEDVEPANSNSTRSLLTAPLGIPFCPASVGGARRTPGGSLGMFLLPSVSSSSSSFDNAELSDTEALKKRLDQIAGAQGLEGVTMDCANLLNNGVDAYLKRLIKSCIELVGARSGHEQIKQTVYKPHIPGKHPQGINGIWQAHSMHVQNAGSLMEAMQETKSQCSVSLLDFKVAMELNPMQLGEDWPLLLEKICLHGFEE